jgi:acetyl esterase/lipase
MLASLRGFARRADAILAPYPAFCTDEKRFFPSVLMSVDEDLLSSAALQFILACFTRNGGKTDSNPILSPIYAPTALLKMIPPTKLLPCEVDPLRDQSFYFAHRLLQVGNKCEIYLMKDHIHGFNNIDQNYVGVNEFRRSTLLTESLLRQTFIDIRDSRKPHEAIPQEL